MNTSVATSTCTLNGHIVSCAELADKAGSFLKWGFGGFVVFGLIFLLATIFWIMMLVHAIKYNIEHKPIWILVLLLTGILGAIVYYFAVKRGFVPPSTPISNPVVPTPPTQPTAQ